jgi:hypothetical protein
MRAVGDKQRETIRLEFDRAISIDFPGMEVRPETAKTDLTEISLAFPI